MSDYIDPLFKLMYPQGIFLGYRQAGARLSPEKGALLLIVNPVAGAGRGTRLAAEVAKTWQSHGYRVETAITSGPGEATVLAQATIGRPDLQAVFAVGGDGTVNEVASGLLNAPIPLGIVPMGSGNGLARHLGYGAWKDRDPSHLKTVWIDSGVVNDRPFFVTCGIGLEGAVAHAFAGSRRRGLVTYGRHTWRLLRQARPIKASVDLRWINTPYRHPDPDSHRMAMRERTAHLTINALSITAANAGQWGNNCWVAPEATLEDGQIDIVCLMPGPLRRHVRTLARMYRRLAPDPMASVRARVCQARIRTEEVTFLHIDGEPRGETRVLDVTVRPESLLVLAPGPFS